MALKKNKIRSQKLTIKPLEPSKLPAFSVLFNPNSYTISKTVSWQGASQTGLNAPVLTFGGGGSRQLTLELFFDVTEPIDGREVKDVREETDKVVALTRIERDAKLPQPPTCEISWGNASNSLDFPFVGVVDTLTQRFTLFDADGTPLRATLTVGVKGFLDPEKDKRETDPEMTTRQVKRGDTLSAIAAELYGDPARWRVIAEANRLDDPRRLEIGRTLTIPKTD